MGSPLDDLIGELSNPRLAGLNEFPPSEPSETYFMNVFCIYDNHRAVHHKLTRYEYLLYRQEVPDRNGLAR